MLHEGLLIQAACLYHLPLQSCQDWVEIADGTQTLLNGSNWPFGTADMTMSTTRVDLRLSGLDLILNITWSFVF